MHRRMEDSDDEDVLGDNGDVCALLHQVQPWLIHVWPVTIDVLMYCTNCNDTHKCDK